MTALSPQRRMGGTASVTPRSPASAASPRADREVGRDPAPRRPGAAPPASCRVRGPRGPPARRPPPPGRMRRCRLPPAGGRGPAPSVATCCATAVFSPEKLKSHPLPAEQRSGKAYGSRIALGSQALQCGPTRPAQAEQLGHLVERLAHRVVDGPAEPPVTAYALHGHALAMTAGDEEQQVREGCSASDQTREAGRQRVGFQVVDGDERFSARNGQSLGEAGAHDQAADKAGTGRGGAMLSRSATRSFAWSRTPPRPAQEGAAGGRAPRSPGPRRHRPRGSCWLSTASARIVPSPARIAAAVSSQDVSIASVGFVMRGGPERHCCYAAVQQACTARRRPPSLADVPPLLLSSSCGA